MKTLVPNYYHKFKCIAGKCRHNCCIGWEIDIDEDTLEFYRDLSGELGEKVRKNIDFNAECPHFVLKTGDRCPFLEQEGLCEIIKKLGENALCDICTDHPRFRNFFSEHTELGIGLCCEEAARVILKSEEPFELIPLDEEFEFSLSDEEKKMLDERDEIFSVIRDRRKSVFERMEKISSRYSFALCGLFPEKLCSLFLSLERLDERWTSLLENMGNFCLEKSVLSDKSFSACFEQLLCYLVFRHFADGMYNGSFVPRIKFAIAACLLVAQLCDKYSQEDGDPAIADMAEFARMFSAEIEYSEENLDTVFDTL